MTSGRDRRVAAMLAEAFADLPTAVFLVAERTERIDAVAGQFTILAEHARTAGGVITAGEPGVLAAAVVWFDHTSTPDPVDGYEARLRAACGPHTDRFLELDTVMDAHHPTEPHHYIALVGTRPGQQGKGIATALLKQACARLDQSATAAYLEAVSEQTVRLYERCGFQRYADAFAIAPGGPHLHPMWRTPKPPNQ